MEKAIVKVEHLWHKYSVQWAIQDINFEIYHKGIVGLLGSNGAGKSTTMNIICGVLNQTQGVVYINGINTRKDPVGAKRNIGFLPQKPPLYTDHNVDEYLTYCAHLRQMDRKLIKNAVERAKQRTGISHFSKRLVKSLSGGYQQRLGIAQSIIHNPKFVVLDEPTNGLDPNQILEVRKLIKEIAEDHAVLLSTHILSEVEVICDEIKMIENGKLIFSGTLLDFHNTIQPNNIIIKLDNPPSEAILKEVFNVDNIHILDGKTFRIKVNEADYETTSEIAKKCIEKGWGLMEIMTEKVSLEEIFAQLSGKKTNQKK